MPKTLISRRLFGEQSMHHSLEHRPWDFPHACPCGPEGWGDVSPSPWNPFPSIGPQASLLEKGKRQVGGVGWSREWGLIIDKAALKTYTQAHLTRASKPPAWIWILQACAVVSQHVMSCVLLTGKVEIYLWDKNTWGSMQKMKEGTLRRPLDSLKVQCLNVALDFQGPNSKNLRVLLPGPDSGFLHSSSLTLEELQALWASVF